MLKLSALIAILSLAKGYQVVPSSTWSYSSLISVAYEVSADVKYWARFDSYYDGSDMNIWDIVGGLNLATAVKVPLTFTILDFYQYNPLIEFALFDLTPKVQLGIARPDLSLLGKIPFDVNVFSWVDYTFLSWSIVHQNNLNLPITSLGGWLYQLFTGGMEYLPFSFSDLQFYGNASYYYDPVLSGDLSTIINMFVAGLLPGFTG